MKKGNRAERRHHNKRLLKNRYEREVRSWYPRHDENREEVLGWCLRRARKRLHTNVVCSCIMCGNPRRQFKGKLSSWASLTEQEIKANDNLRDGMEEVLTEES